MNAIVTPVPNRAEPLVLLSATFIISICGLIYELLAGTLSSYLLGDSVYQFSIVIGLFVSSMGVGSFLSRYMPEPLEQSFTIAQTLTGILGGSSAPLLFFAFTWLDHYNFYLFFICISLGGLVGLEVPLVTRILEQHHTLKVNISNVLTIDYIGALAAALLFPLLLMPLLGLMGTSLLFGLLNVSIAIVMIWLFRDRVNVKLLSIIAGTGFIFLSTLLFHSEKILNLMERRLYQAPIIFAETTPYQRLVLTRQQDRFRLYINGGLQFDSFDEYRYHEALVHPAMNLAVRPERILILGGGDGMAAREVLKYPQVQHITLVDLDERVTQLFSENSLLTPLNSSALKNPKVSIINKDAWDFLDDSNDYYDLVIIDLPDPQNSNLSKLYTKEFYSRISNRLTQGGLVVTQATSPFFARSAFWCINNTLDATPSPLREGATLYTQPYHSYVPSFGLWGFVIAGHHRVDWATLTLPDTVALNYLYPEVLESLIHFSADTAFVNTEINTLQAHPLLDYYQVDSKRWFP
jgi:spermidine synthase